MADRVELALVGCGGMMGAHVNGLRELWKHDLQDFRVIATCDPERERAAKLASECAGFQGTTPQVYTDLETLLAKESGLRAVDISTAHREHHAVAVPCLQAGKHVTIEKPLGLTMRAGKTILDAAKQAGVKLQVAENYRRSPEHRAINWAIRQGRIGTLRMIFWVDVGERLWYWGWRDEKDIAGGGWALDGGVHFADLFRYHVGEVNKVSAISRAYQPTRYRKRETLEDPTQATVEDTIVALLWFENGVTGQWTTTSAAPARGFNQRVVYGDKGALDFGAGLFIGDQQTPTEQLVKEYLAAASAEEKERWFPGGVTDTVATELHEFFQAVLGRGPLEMTGLEGYKDQAISEALYESNVLGRPVEITQIESLEVEAYQGELNRQVGL